MADSLMDAALRVLALRDHSVQELRRKLSTKGFDGTEVEAVLERLFQLNYLDDRRFARSFAESAMRNGRGYGARLQQELARRGVSGAVIGEVMEELCADYDEGETLAALLGRKFASFDPATATDKEKRRVVGYLQRKGFTLSAILATIRSKAFHTDQI